MYWALAGLTICAAIVIGGRAHSRYLDRLDQKAWLNSMTPPLDFAVVCDNCGSVSVRSDYAEATPPSTIIKCNVCDSPRGTLGVLQSLAKSNRQG
jgi:hypothetical protein